MRSVITLILYIAAIPAVAGGLACQPVEYAQYKDRAATHSGQVELAHEHCQAQMRIAGAQNQMRIGTDARITRIVDAAAADISTCTAEQGKIQDALLAAKAKESVWKFISAQCQGPEP